MAWRTSNTMASEFCVEALQQAIVRFGKPEVFNTDSQFTAELFTETLQANATRINGA
jgi:putative transposase